MSEQIEFPCLESDDRRADDGSYIGYVCVLRDGHEGDHGFIPSDELMVKVEAHGVEFSVERQGVN